MRLVNAEEGTVEQCARKEGRGRAWRLAVRVRQPGMHGRQPHLGTEPDHNEQEADLEPDRVKLPGKFVEHGKRQGAVGINDIQGQGDKKAAEQGSYNFV